MYIDLGSFIYEMYCLYFVLNLDGKRSKEGKDLILDIALWKYSELRSHSVSKFLYLDSGSAITLSFPGMCAAVSQTLLSSHKYQILLAIELHQ